MSLRIQTEEYRDRLTNLRSSLSAAELDLFVVSSTESIYYLTGAVFEPLERPFFLLVPLHGDPCLLVPMLDYEHMKKAAKLENHNIKTYREFPAPKGQGWPDKLRELLSDTNRIGVEPSLPQAIFTEFLEYSPKALPLIERLRLVKSPTEVNMIRRAAYYADLGVEKLIEASYYNAKVAEGIAQTRRVSTQIVRDVDEWEPLTTKVVMATWAAPRSAMPHSVPDLNDRLGEGPHVALALTRVNGYAAESERTYFTGPPSGETREAFEAMMAARRVAFDSIRPGVPCEEVDGAVNEFLQKEGYGGEDQRLHRTGHGFGLSNHEAPWVAEGSQDRLAENMVISVEPGIYLSGVGGVRHSDTVLVTKDGPELLTTFPTDMDSLLVRGLRPLTRLKGLMVRRALRLDQKVCVAATGSRVLSGTETRERISLETI